VNLACLGPSLSGGPPASLTLRILGSLCGGHTRAQFVLTRMLNSAGLAVAWGEISLSFEPKRPSKRAEMVKRACIPGQNGGFFEAVAPAAL
jgi:hypothetical protein